MGKSKLFLAVACAFIFSASNGQTPNSLTNPNGVTIDSIKTKHHPTGGYTDSTHNGRILHQKAIGMGQESDDSIPETKAQQRVNIRDSLMKKSKRRHTEPLYPDTLNRHK